VTDVATRSLGPIADATRSETDLVRQARRGDHEAYRLLVRRYEKIAFQAAYAITGSAVDAEDATQEGFLKAYQALDRFRLGAPFRPWLLRIVANEARSWRRASRRREQLASRLAFAPEGSSTVEADALASEERRRLIAALDALAADDRLAILARFILDLSEEETAAVLGVRRAAAKMRVFRALRRLRRSLEAGEP
jgi:RNA polymerase sigma factor (sigma-70 family)